MGSGCREGGWTGSGRARSRKKEGEGDGDGESGNQKVLIRFFQEHVSFSGKIIEEMWL